MNTTKRIFLYILILALPVVARARLVDELLASYDGIKSVSCEVRRTSWMSEKKMKSLSRVHYQKPDRIHVDSFAPIKRRHVADGKRLYYYVAGDPLGFSRPVNELDENWLISLRKVPATAMEHLLKIGAAKEDKLSAGTGYFARCGYKTDKPYIVLSLVATNKLQLVEYYETPKMENLLLRCEYKQFEEVLPGVWFSLHQETKLNFKGIESRETVQFLNVSVNKPIAKSLFNHEYYFRKVKFVDDFEEIYK
jgi:hypothetical protein